MNNTYLSIGHGDEPLIDQLIRERIPRLTLHDIRLRLLVRHGDSGHHVCTQVNTQDGDGAQGQRDIRQNKHQERGDLWDVGGQGVRDGFLQVVKDKTTFLDASYDGGKVVVEQNHISSLNG